LLEGYEIAWKYFANENLETIRSISRTDFSKEVISSSSFDSLIEKYQQGQAFAQSYF
jgi:hypothetical protein